MGNFTVSQLNKYIKRNFDNDYALYNLSVEGEISNFKESHGNYYFVLKDESSAISCIYFNNYGNGKELDKNLEGSKVIVKGRVTVYEKNGTYSIYVTEIEQSGLGKYYIELEKLKKKLYEKGMFDDMYKKPIPEYPTSVGVVTAKTGAAIKDITKTIYKKNPYTRIVLYPATVQGDNAYLSVIKGIRKLDDMNLDVIIIGRGGGSIEDLYCFNDERLAEIIFNAKTPIISAVGHEINESISDLVADAKVATPTAAGELASFDYMQLIEDIDENENLLLGYLVDKFDEIDERLIMYESKLNALSPYSQVMLKIEKLDNYKNKIENVIKNKLSFYNHKFELYVNNLEMHNPLKKLKNGMVYAVNSKKENINKVDDVKNNEKIKLYLKDGSISAKVLKTKEGGLISAKIKENK